MTTLKQKVVSGMLWRLLEQFGTLGIGFIVSILMARLLGPNDYGMVALLGIFIAIAGTFVQCGFGTALVQKEKVTDSDFDSVFIISVALSLVLYGVLFFVAPWIADYYQKPILTSVMRILAIILIFNAVNGVQDAVLQRNMWFHLSFRISTVSIIVSGLVGISLAFAGLGVWALVWSQIAMQGVSMMMRWFLIGWKPHWNFSLESSKKLFLYSWKLMVSGLLETTFTNIYGLIIGKIYSATDLGFFDKGRKFPNMVMSAVNGTLMSVAFPALSQVQRDSNRLRSGMRKMIQCSTFVVMPMMMLLAVVAEPLVLILLGEKWHGAVPFLQIACFGFSFWPFHTVNLEAINAIGRSDIFLKLEIVKKFFIVVVICLFCHRGVVLFALVSTVIGTLFSVIVNAWPSKKLLNYSVMMQVRDVLPTIGMCLVSGGISWSIRLLIVNSYVLIVCQSVVFLVAFLTCCIVCKSAVLREYLIIMSNTFPFSSYYKRMITYFG